VTTHLRNSYIVQYYSDMISAYTDPYTGLPTCITSVVVRSPQPTVLLRLRFTDLQRRPPRDFSVYNNKTTAGPPLHQLTRLVQGRPLHERATASRLPALARSC